MYDEWISGFKSMSRKGLEYRSITEELKLIRCRQDVVPPHSWIVWFYKDWSIEIEDRVSVKSVVQCNAVFVPWMLLLKTQRR